MSNIARGEKTWNYNHNKNVSIKGFCNRPGMTATHKTFKQNAGITQRWETRVTKNLSIKGCTASSVNSENQNVVIKRFLYLGRDYKIQNKTFKSS